MKGQNFIPNKMECYDSDDSTFEIFGTALDVDSEDSDSNSSVSLAVDDENTSSTQSEFGSEDNADLPEENLSNEEEKKTDMKDSSDFSDNDEDISDSESTSSEEAEATMEDIFGTKPNMEATRDHPPNLKTNVSILDLCFHPENDILAAASIDGDCIVYQYNSEKVEEVQRFSHHKQSCRQVCYNENGDLLYTISKDKSLAVVDIEHSSVKTHLEDAHESSIYSFYEIDDNMCATGDDNGIVKLWDLRTSSPIHEYNCGEETVSSFLSCEKNKFLSATLADGSLTGINLKKNRMEVQSEMYESEFTCQSLVKGDEKLVVGSGSGTLYIFKWGEFGYHIDCFRGHPDVVHCQVAITDKLILTGCEDGNIRAVHLYPHRFFGVVGQHKDFAVENLAVSSDGNLLASCSLDEEIQFWNIEYLYNKYASRKRVRKKAGISRNLPSSKMRNRGEFFRDFPLKVELDDDGCGPVPGPSYESD